MTSPHHGPLPAFASALEKKEPRHKPGLSSLNAVITVRHLLREEKQGMRPCGVSFTDDYRGVHAPCLQHMSENALF
jgi:hypothetical protein